MQAELTKLVTNAQDGDVIVFHFSGHGTQIPSANGDEKGGSPCLPTLSHSYHVPASLMRLGSKLAVWGVTSPDGIVRGRSSKPAPTPTNSTPP